MEKHEWITIDMFSREYESSHAELCIEVRIWCEYGADYLTAEPVYYKLVGKSGKILMDGAYASKHAEPRMWSFIQAVVECEYTETHLDWMVENDIAFEALHRDRADQDRMDREWYRASVL